MIERIPWSDEAAAAMADPAGRDCIPFLKVEVETGRSKLWRCTDGASRAYVITRMDANPPELVIAYCQGRDMHKFGPWFIEAAHKRGVPLRIHTTQPAMCRYLRKQFGLELQEFVLRSKPWH